MQRVLTREMGYKFIDVVRRGPRYICVSHEWFKFVDAYLFLGPETSLDQFLKMCQMDRSQEKLCFPYSLMERSNLLEFLSRTEFPKLSEFGDTLHYGKVVVSEELYARSLAVFRDQCTTMFDYLRIYTMVDTVSFLHAMVYYMQLIRDKFAQNLCNFSTLPALSESYFYAESRQQPGFFWLPRAPSKREHERTHLDRLLYKDLKADSFGGLSCVYNRLGLSGVTVANVQSEKRLSHGCVEGQDFVG